MSDRDIGEVDPTITIDRTIQNNPLPEVGTPQIETPTGQNPSTLPEAKNDSNLNRAMTANPAVPSVGDLPWATVLMPTTSAGQGGIGQNKHELQVESWVFGFFADGDDCQQPFIVGVWPGGPGAGTGVGQAGVAPGGGDGTTPSAGTGSSGPVAPDNRSVSDKELSAARYLIAKGYTPAQAAGIVGNLSLESGMRTTAVNPGDGRDGSNSIGLAQWNSGRAIALRRRPGWETMEGQLDFVDYELKSTHSRAMALLRNANSPSSAADIICRYYEVPANASAKSPARQARAESIYRRLMEASPR